MINSRIGDFAFVGFRATDLELRHRGRRTSIRADVGSPFIIGDSADIEDRVTFHALSGTSIRIGANLDTDDNVVFHGPLVVGDNLTIADDAVLFRATSVTG